MGLGGRKKKKGRTPAAVKVEEMEQDGGRGGVLDERHLSVYLSFLCNLLSTLTAQAAFAVGRLTARLLYQVLVVERSYFLTSLHFQFGRFFFPET